MTATCSLAKSLMQQKELMRLPEDFRMSEMELHAVLSANNVNAHTKARVPSLLGFISNGGSIIDEDAHLDVSGRADGMQRRSSIGHNAIPR